MRFFHIAALLLVFHAGLSQNLELGKVTMEEMKEAFHPLDSSAPAAILFKKGKTYFESYGFGWYLITEVETRIKIYKKTGYHYAEKELILHSENKAPAFHDAAVYNLVDGAIQITKPGADAEYITPVSNSKTLRKLVLPNIKEGSIIEYKYKLISTNYFRFPDWYFQYSIPVNHVEYKVIIPTYYTYRNVITGAADVKQSKPMLIREKKYSENVITYSAHNIKAIKEEEYVSNLIDYMAAVKHELISIKDRGVVRDFSTDWKSVTKKLFDNEYFGKQLAYRGYYRKALRDIEDFKLSREEKLEQIFSHIREHMTWNGNSDILCETGVKQAYDSKLGNVADINLMLVSMLREGGFMANPVILSTRSNGYANHPSLDLFNYVIAAVETDKGTILLDATSKNAMPGILPTRAINIVGRLIKKEGLAKEISLVPVKISKEITNTTAELNAKGLVSGRLRKQYLDYKAFNFREEYGSVNKDIYLQLLGEMYRGTQVDSYKIHNDSIFKPVIEEYIFTNDAVCDIVGDRIYVNPMLFFNLEENPFKSNERQYPVDFTYPFENRYLTTINLPAGFIVESLPASASFLLGDSIGSFKYDIAEDKGQIQLMVVFGMHQTILYPEEYADLKEFYAKMIDKQKEKIVLKKI